MTFVVLGVVTYRLTAPPVDDTPGFSIGRLVNEIRREVAGHRVRTERRLLVTQAVSPDLRELRVADLRGTVQVVGAPRADVVAEARIEVAGLDEADAERQAAQVELDLSRSGDALLVVIRAPPRAPRLRVDVVLHVPERLAIRLDTVGRAEVTGVADVVLNTRGDTSIQHVVGAIRGEQRGGDLRIADAARLDVVTRLCDVTLERIAEEVRVEITGGRLDVRGSPARLRIDARRTDVRIDRGDQPIVIDHAEGEVDVREARAPVRISGRRTDVEIRLAVPVPVDLTGFDGDATIVLPAEGGVHVDAAVRDGDIQLDGIDHPLHETVEERRLNGSIGGNGPVIVVRMERGRLTLRRSGSAGSSSGLRPPDGS